MADHPAAQLADEAAHDAAGLDGPGRADVVADEVLVEEVSIDGMCGVY
ncbi:MAG TPA: mycofactocin precursor MftA [Streptosporangiaceae bacterium]|nr:mycofactocin precursor MftA [Streptosporangiaceae bacterium]